MGDKISALPAATSVDGTEIIPIVQGGATKKVTGTILRSPTGVAGGDLTGTYPNPTLASITTAQTAVGSGAAIPVLTTDAKGRVVSLTTVVNPALTTAQIAGLSTNAAAALATAGVAGLSTFAARADHQHARPTPAEIGALAATATAGGDLAGNYPAPSLAAITTAQVSVGSTSQIPVLSIDSKGRVTALTSVPIGSSAGGTVTKITAGVGLTGGEITESGIISIADVTVPQSVGSSTVVPVITVNAQGQVTSLTTAQITSGTLTTTAPSPLAGTAVAGVSTEAARADHQHVFPSAGQIGAIPTGATAGGDLTGSLPSPTLVAITTAQANVGSASAVPVISIDAKGRVTSLTTAALSTLSGATLSTNLPSALATTAVAGLSSFAARLDHQHVFPTAAQVGALAATATASGDLTGNYPGPTLAAITSAQIGVGSASVIPVISTDAKGRVTALTTVAFAALTTNQIAGLSTNAASALATTGVAGISTFAARADHQHVFPTATQVGALGATAAASGDLTGNYPGPTLAAITTAQSNVGSSSLIPVISIDAKGRVTSLSTANAASAIAAFRNRIINGDMIIDQRNNGAASNSSINSYFLDRWVVNQTPVGKLIAQQNAGSITPPVGFTKYLGLTSQSAYTIGGSDYFLINQPIEGQNIRDFGWGTANASTVTLSFVVYSSLTGNFTGCVGNSLGNRSYPFAYSIPVANTWTTISITIPGDTTGTWVTTNAVSAYIYFSLGVGASYVAPANSWSAAFAFAASGGVSVVGTAGATFYITGIQFERGSSASAFETLPYSTQLGLCQRYYDTTTMWVPATGDPRQVFYKTSMRASPTISGGGTGFAATNQTVNGASVTQTTAGNQTLVFVSEL